MSDDDENCVLSLFLNRDRSHSFRGDRLLHFIFLFFFSRLRPSPTTAADSGGHGPIQPTHPRHLGDQFPHLPVALPQSQPLGVRARQPRLPQPQRQAEGGMELEVT